MRQISPQRVKREQERHLHFFNRQSPEMFQIMNVEWVVELVKLGLKLTNLSNLTYRNALDIKVVHKNLFFDKLPVSFDGYTILLMTDLHIDGIPELPQIILNIIDSLDYDICLLGGDYRFNTQGSTLPTICGLKKLLPELCSKSPVIGVLGNHDQYEIALEMDDMGVRMLMNEHINISRGNDKIHICGIDDCHYYTAHDLNEALKETYDDTFKVLLSHSPEIYKAAEEMNLDLLLSGHTHAGQLCLPGRFPIISQAHIPRNIIYNTWKYKSLQGYTSAGTGSSGTPARLFCPPEVVHITLRSQSD